MERTICLMLSGWNNQYICDTIQGIQMAIKDTECKVHAFLAYDNYSTKGFYDMEKQVFMLPNPSDYDGLIIALSSAGALIGAKDAIARFREAGVPMVSVDCMAEGATFLGIDNASSVYDMTDYLYTKCGRRDFIFVGGIKDHPENQARLQGFKRCLEEKGISVPPENIRFYDYTGDGGKQAYFDFKELGLNRDVAVVCANDFMAMGYAEMAMADGLRIPEDFVVTGYDFLVEGQYFTPSLTTVGRNWLRLGYESVKCLLRACAGHTLDKAYYFGGNIEEGESTGNLRQDRDCRRELLRMYKEVRLNESWENKSSGIRSMFSAESTMEGFQGLLESVCEELDMRDMAVVVNRLLYLPNGYRVLAGADRTRTEETVEENKLRAYGRNEICDLDTADGLIPDFMKTVDSLLVITSLHFSDRNFGYSIMPFNEELFEKYRHRTLIESIYLSLEGIRQSVDLQKLNAELNRLYVGDTLTGLYNRNGYFAEAEKFYHGQKGKVYIVYCDMDDLKKMNDKYGHEVGDASIIGLARGLEAGFDDTEILVRMGGDEFLVIGPYVTEEELLKRQKTAEEFMTRYSDENRLPIPIRVSMGHVINESDDEEIPLEELVKIADNRMYENKQKRKGIRITT